MGLWFWGVCEFGVGVWGLGIDVDLCFVWFGILCSDVDGDGFGWWGGFAVMRVGFGFGIWVWV